MNRLHNLDYLRGIAAFCIMIYHYSLWTFGIFGAESFIGRIGVYGVSIFYVLSGLTLFYVYHERMKPSWDDIKAFAQKRFFRIFPLLWLATLASIILSKQVPDFAKFFLNLTGLFGLFSWNQYYAIGAWSIGNELVFYLFFPFFILFLKRSKLSLLLFSLVIFFIYVYFAFYLLDKNTALSNQWRNYVNPLNQVFLFLGGFLIGTIFQNRRISKLTTILLLIMGLGLFIFYPIQKGGAIYLVTGVNRLVFTFSCFIICLAFYKLAIELPKWIDRPFALLGEASYSVYLLHPIAFGVVGFLLSFASRVLGPLPNYSGFVISLVLTLLLSYFVFQYFEKYFMRLGKEKKLFAHIKRRRQAL